MPQPGRDPGAGQRGLAGSGGPDHGEEPGPSQPLQALVDLLVAPEEVLRIVDVVGGQAGPRAAGCREVGCRHLQVRVLLEHGLLQLDQLCPRVQPQLIGEDGSCATQGGQRLGLPAGLVLGPRQQRPAVLPQRFLPGP